MLFPGGTDGRRAGHHLHGRRQRASTTGRVTAWQVMVDTAPYSSRQKRESGQGASAELDGPAHHRSGGRERSCRPSRCRRWSPRPRSRRVRRRAASRRRARTGRTRRASLGALHAAHGSVPTTRYTPPALPRSSFASSSFPPPEVLPHQRRHVTGTAPGEPSESRPAFCHHAPRRLRRRHEPDARPAVDSPGRHPGGEFWLDAPNQRALQGFLRFVGGYSTAPSGCGRSASAAGRASASPSIRAAPARASRDRRRRDAAAAAQRTSGRTRSSSTEAPKVTTTKALIASRSTRTSSNDAWRSSAARKPWQK